MCAPQWKKKANSYHPSFSGEQGDSSILIEKGEEKQQTHNKGN
jgi:hypothetical protein